MAASAVLSSANVTGKSLGITDNVVVCNNQKLGVILSDDDAGTALGTS